MSKLRTFVERESDGFKSNAETYEELLEELRDRIEEARRGGGEKARKRHEERGKLPVRDRIDLLLDPNTAFLELSPLAAFGMYDGEVPAAGMITGIGREHTGLDQHDLGGQEAPSGAGGCRAEPSSLYLLGRLRWGFLTLAGRGLPGQGALRTHLLQPGPDER